MADWRKDLKMDIVDSMCLGENAELEEAFGDLYKAPQVFPHFEEVLVAEVPASGEDGSPLRIYEARCPARFYRIVVDPVDEGHAEAYKRPGLVLTIGSGCEGLVISIAKAIAEGMLVPAFPER